MAALVAVVTPRLQHGPWAAMAAAALAVVTVADTGVSTADVGAGASVVAMEVAVGLGGTETLEVAETGAIALGMVRPTGLPLDPAALTGGTETGTSPAVGMTATADAHMTTDAADSETAVAATVTVTTAAQVATWNPSGAARAGAMAGATVGIVTEGIEVTETVAATMTGRGMTTAGSAPMTEAATTTLASHAATSCDLGLMRHLVDCPVLLHHSRPARPF